MAVVLNKLYGVEAALETQLKAKGIRDSEDLLKLHRSLGSAQALAARLELDVETASALVNRAQLVRIRGIGEVYTGLLEAAGVKSVQDLALKSPEHLRGQFERINESEKVVGRAPSLAMVNGWVTKAQKFPLAK